MAATTPLLAGLLQKVTIDDHDEILRASNAALKKSSSDAQAQDVQVVALIKLDRFQDALKFIEQTGSSIKERLPLEYAYVLYKTGNLQGAADVAAKTDGRGALHLEAQAQYRLENPERILNIYQRIQRSHVAEEEYDIKVNFAGAEAQHQWLGALSSKRPSADDLQYFETAYNAACGSIARQEYAQAEMLLKRAYELCKHHEELDDEQKKEELQPIRVQQLFVLLVQGKTDEADALADDISVETIADLETRTVAQSNKLLTSLKPSNPFLLQKALSSVPTLSAGEKLFSYQATAFASNQKSADLEVFKYNGLADSKKPSSDASVEPHTILASVYSAAARAENEVSKAAIRKVTPSLKQRPTDVGFVLTLVHMYLLVGNTTSAVEVIESLFRNLESSENDASKAVRYTPGLVSILVGLYRSLGREADVKGELSRAAAYWRTKDNAPPSLLRAAGSSLLGSTKNSDVDAAAEMFTKLRKQRPDDKAAIAGYVASHATQNAEAVQLEAEKLTSIADLTSNIDVEALETAGIPQASNALAIAVGRSRKRATDAAASKPKRICKSRMPRDYDPKKTPDPERWLAMRDRSYYRPPKGKKKGKKSGGDQQGGTVNESLNMEARSGTATPVIGGSSGGGGGGKKKKGKR